MLSVNEAKGTAKRGSTMRKKDSNLMNRILNYVSEYVNFDDAKKELRRVAES